jgi:ketosteroid isomerase-like protein
MHRFLHILFLALATGWCQLSAQAQTAAEAEVLAFEKARFEATRTGDTAKLHQMLADDLVWVHSTGKRQNKAEYIRDLATSSVTYKSITVERAQVRLYGDLAVSNGTAVYDAISFGKPMKTRAYHLAVYRRQNGQWQVLAWQTTRVGK